jgi:hypothetical protein
MIVTMGWFGAPRTLIFETRSPVKISEASMSRLTSSVVKLRRAVPLITFWPTRVATAT